VCKVAPLYGSKNNTKRTRFRLFWVWVRWKICSLIGFCDQVTYNKNRAEFFALVHGATPTLLQVQQWALLLGLHWLLFSAFCYYWDGTQNVLCSITSDKWFIFSAKYFCRSSDKARGWMLLGRSLVIAVTSLHIRKTDCLIIRCTRPCLTKHRARPFTWKRKLVKFFQLWDRFHIGLKFFLPIISWDTYCTMLIPYGDRYNCIALWTSTNCNLTNITDRSAW